MRSFNSLVKFYERILDDRGIPEHRLHRHIQTMVHARAILTLLPILKTNSAFDALVMGTAHFTLWMGYDKGDKVIHIWGLREDTYQVSIFVGSTFSWQDAQTVNLSQIVDLLKHYVDKLEPASA